MPDLFEFPTWPSFAQDEIAAVSAVLGSGRVNYWTGSQCKTFEKQFAEYCGVPFAIACANGTLALELALRSVGVQAGDEVILPARTYIATASAVVAVGAIPIVADVDFNSQTLSLSSVENVLTDKTRAVIAVHLAGYPCDMAALLAFAKQNNLKVIEDCAQAHGAKIDGRCVGSFGHAAAFSFCQDKIMTTGGEGGMMLTQDENVFQTAWSYKEHGKSILKSTCAGESGHFQTVHDTFGSNFRLSEMQAAIGIKQLEKLPTWLSRRRDNVHLLSDCLLQYDFIAVPSVDPNREHAYYKFYVTVDTKRLPKYITRDVLIRQLRTAGVPCFTGICPEVQNELAFAQLERKQITTPVAKLLGECSMMFLVHPTLTSEDLLKQCQLIKCVLDPILQ